VGIDGYEEPVRQQRRCGILVVHTPIDLGVSADLHISRDREGLVVRLPSRRQFHSLETLESSHGAHEVK
jgi:hypothetical protein